MQGHQAHNHGGQGPRPGSVCVGKSVKSTASGKTRKLSQNCLNLCDSVCSLKCIHLRKIALSSSLSQYDTARPTSERYGDAAHTGYSREALAGDSNDQAAKASMSVTECVENYSKNLTLVTLHKSGGTPFNHPVSKAWCSL